MKCLAASLLFLVLPAAHALAQGVRDSVRLSFSLEPIYETTTIQNGQVLLGCGAWMLFRHDDFAGGGRGAYTYSRFPYDWTPIRWDAQPAPGAVTGAFETYSVVGPIEYTAEACGQHVSLAAATIASANVYAIHTYPEGPPVAKFDTTRGDGLTVGFDGSSSFEPVRGRKMPVASYRWAFGDGSPVTTGAAPSHTYDEAGTYIVTLEVTDDDGQTDVFSRSVTVREPTLVVWAEAAEPDRRYRRTDSVAVIGIVENRSGEAIADVRVPLDFALVTKFPAVAEPFYKEAATYTRVSSPGRSDTTIAVLGPGERIKIVQSFRVTAYARYKPDAELRLAEATGYGMLLAVTAKDARGEAIKGEPRCAEEPCGTTWRVSPPEYTFALTFKAAPPDGLAAQEVTAVPSGLTAGPSGVQSVVARHRIRTADLSERVCRSGCAEVEVVVTDEQGRPVDSLEVALSAPLVSVVTASPALGAVTSGQRGRFCDPDPAGTGTRCGSTLRGFTDAEGRLHSVYLTPGVVSDVPVTITARLHDPQSGNGKAERTLTVRPNVVRETALTVDEATSRALMAALLVRGFSDTGQQLAELPATFCKAVGTTLGGTASASGVDVSFLGDLPADALDWGCGELPSAPFPTVLTLGKPFGELVPLVWLLEGTQLPGTGLAHIDTRVAPPFVQVRDAFTPHVSDALTAMARANPAASQLSPLDLLRAQTVEVKIVEVSYLTDLSTDLAQTEMSSYGLYVSIGGEEMMVTAGYDGRVWLQEAALNAPHLGTSAREGDTQISTASGGARAGAAMDDARGMEDVRVMEVASRALADTLGAGDIVALGVGLPNAETVQVRSVEGVTVRLTTPLRFDHVAGEVLRVVRRRAIGVPDRPVPFAPYDSASATPRPLLQWSLLAPATNVDVQIAQDTLFASLVQEHAALRADSLRLTGLAEGQRYAWRVRARSELGDGPWSRPRTFVAATPVAIDGAPIVDLPSEATLGVPYPNPARGAVAVRFALTRPDRARVTVVDALGRTIALLADGDLAAGWHSATWHVEAAPGVYFVRLSAGRDVRTQQIVVVR